HNVKIIRVTRQEVLMVRLGRIKVSAGLDLGDDRRIKHMGLIELGDVGLGDARLLWIGRENRRAVLVSCIRALTVELARVMGDRKIDLQDMAVADTARIKSECPVAPVLTIS